MVFAGLAIPPEVKDDIHRFAAFLQSFIDERVPALLHAQADDWQQRFEIAGDMAYGQFNAKLLEPLRKPLKAAGLKPTPQLPGRFMSSREWGDVEETHQQRWFYSIIARAGASPLGAIAFGAHHDHHRFRLPRTPEVRAVLATTPTSVEKTLAVALPGYATALPFRQWWAQHGAAESAS